MNLHFVHSLHTLAPAGLRIWACLGVTGSYSFFIQKTTIRLEIHSQTMKQRMQCLIFNPTRNDARIPGYGCLATENARCCSLWVASARQVLKKNVLGLKKKVTDFRLRFLFRANRRARKLAWKVITLFCNVAHPGCCTTTTNLRTYPP